MMRRLLRKALIVVVLFMVVAWLVSQCTAKTVESLDKSNIGSGPILVPTGTLTPAPPRPPTPELVGNRLTGLQECGPGQRRAEQREFDFYVDQGGVWSREKVCRWFEKSTALGGLGLNLGDGWQKLLSEALPSKTRPESGSWYRSGLLHPDGSVEFVWADRDQVNANAVTLDAVVRP